MDKITNNFVSFLTMTRVCLTRSLRRIMTENLETLASYSYSIRTMLTGSIWQDPWEESCQTLQYFLQNITIKDTNKVCLTTSLRRIMSETSVNFVRQNLGCKNQQVSDMILFKNLVWQTLFLVCMQELPKFLTRFLSRILSDGPC